MRPGRARETQGPPPRPCAGAQCVFPARKPRTKTRPLAPSQQLCGADCDDGGAEYDGGMDVEAEFDGGGGSVANGGFVVGCDAVGVEEGGV